MLVNSLRISAFRGIGAELALNLTARLTLLHAPNGTGKTSVCDAIEWALSGKVHRLEVPLHESPTEGVRNLFASDIDTFVEAELLLGSSPFKIRQLGCGSSGRLEIEKTPSVWRNLDRNKLLERLAPNDLPLASTRRLNQSRMDWFRAVRLLDSRDLDILLDDTDNAQAVRGLLFSNLFGTSALQGHEQQLEGILAKMKPPRRIDSETEEFQKQVEEIESLISSTGELASAPFWDASRLHLASAAHHLCVTPDAKALPERLLSSLEASHAAAESRSKQVRTAIEIVTREWDLFQSLAKDIPTIEATLRTETTKLTHVRQQRDQLIAQGQRSAANIEQAVRREQQLCNLKLDELQSQLDAALAQWQSVAGDTGQAINIQALHTAEHTALSRLKSLEQNRAAFDYCAQNIPTWIELSGSLQAGEARLAELQVPDAESIAANDRSLTAANDELRRIDHESSRLAGPLERLKSEGRRLLERMPDEHRCLLCAHDYDSASQLRDAIEAGLNALPAALSALAVQKTEQEAIIARGAKNKACWEQVIVEISKINQTVASAREKLNVVRESMHKTGAELPDFNAPDFASRFESAHRALRERIESERQRSVAAQSRRHAAEVLLEIRNAVLTSSQTLRSLAVEGIAADRIELQTPGLWPDELTRISTQITQVLEQVSETIRTARDKANSEQQQTYLLSQQVSQLALNINSLTDQLAQLRAAALRFNENWIIAAGNCPPSKEALDSLPQQLVKASGQSEKAAIDLRAAAGAIAKAKAAMSQEQQAQANRRRIAELRTGLQKLAQIQKRRGEISSAISSLREAKETFIKQQIQPLCKVITSLYRRAQNNAFITDIGTDDSSEAHKWTVFSDDLRLESIAQLSQGQRQDLALAIFLARARDVRGTFILDEPLLHLDDLNRVALLDVFRVLATEQSRQPMRFIITTASNALVRHFREKFSLLPSNDLGPALRIYRLSGNPRDGVTAAEEKLPSR